MASNLSAMTAACMSVTHAHFDRIVVVVAGRSLSWPRKPTKTVLRIPAMQFVAESNMRTAVLAKSAGTGKKIEVRIGGKPSILARWATRIIRRTKTLCATRPFFRAIATKIGTTLNQLVSGLVGFYGTRRQSVHP